MSNCNSAGATHHLACACREQAHADEVQSLRASLAAAEADAKALAEATGKLRGWLMLALDEHRQFLFDPGDAPAANESMIAAGRALAAHDARVTGGGK